MGWQGGSWPALLQHVEVELGEHHGRGAGHAAKLHGQLHVGGVDGGALLHQFAQEADQLGPLAFDAQDEADAVEAVLVARSGGLAAADAQVAGGGEFAHALQGVVADLAGVLAGGVDELLEVGLHGLAHLREFVLVLDEAGEAGVAGVDGGQLGGGLLVPADDEPGRPGEQREQQRAGGQQPEEFGAWGAAGVHEAAPSGPRMGP